MALLFSQYSLLSFSHLVYSRGQMKLPCFTLFFIMALLCSTQISYCSSLSLSFPNGSSSLVPAQSPSIRRSDFPVDFKFGASTSALQTEGPGNIGGRGPSTWDFMITEGTEFNGQPNTSDVATLSYLRYKEDVMLLKKMGLNVYRFSISWSRILPNGKGAINQEGIDFYNNLINELVANDIEPFVTLFHFDLPVALQTEYNGFLNKKIVEDFKNFCDICFKNFGDRVKYWLTVNEPVVFAQAGYTDGLTIPNDPARYPYIVTHNIVLAHAAVVRHYRKYYLATQGGQIGMPLSVQWFTPYSATKEDQNAATRAFAFYVGWFVEPLVFGRYPSVMRTFVGNRLPNFTAKEKNMVKGAYDFIGINYYTSRYVKAKPIDSNAVPVSNAADQFLQTEVERDGKPIGTPVNGNPNIYIVPDGLRDALIYMKKQYLNPIFYITENGISEPRNDSLPLKKALQDDARIIAILRHLYALEQAMRAGVTVKGYFVWALMDCMEVGSGYSVRFGLGFTDYNNNLKRHLKKSGLWFSKFMKDN